jgi:hypothetical protein
MVTGVFLTVGVVMVGVMSMIMTGILAIWRTVTIVAMVMVMMAMIVVVVIRSLMVNGIKIFIRFK